jgi:hypothetical protein
MNAPLTKTEMQLLVTLKTPTVSLASISQQYLGLAPQRAHEYALINQLPFPTFRLTDSKRAPRMVYVSDLAAHIDSQHERAKETWTNSQV